MARVSKQISLVLIDDNPSTCDGVVALIRAQPGFQVLVVSADVEAALRQVREAKPHLVLLKLRPEGDGSLTVAGALHGELPDSRVIVMGLKPLHEDVAGFVRAGVSGFVMAGASFATFLATIHSVAQGIQVLPLELTASLFEQLKANPARARPKQASETRRLTVRERAVTDLVVQGLSNQAIAARLSIALHTVKGQVHKILSKLAVNNRMEVAAFSRKLAEASAV
jgi:DNA-binding NarL/FixJ family response regulator